MRYFHIITKKIYLLLLICAFSAVNSYADMPRDGFYGKGLVGVSMLADEDFEGSGDGFLDADASFDTGQSYGLAFGYRFENNFALELEAGYRNNGISKLSTSEGTVADDGDLASVSIMVNGLYNLELGSDFELSFGGGVGILEEIDSDIEFSNFAGSQRDLEDTTIALQAILGMNYWLSESLAVSLDGRYLASPNPEISNANGSYDFDYNSFSINLGLSYRF